MLAKNYEKLEKFVNVHKISMQQMFWIIEYESAIKFSKFKIFLSNIYEWKLPIH